MKLPISPRLRGNISSGFTLVELVVVLMTMSLLFTFAYASYREFARRQQVTSALGLLKSDLRLAQQLATSGKKPTSGCTRLDGYELFVECSSKRYTIYPRCDGATGSTAFKTVNFPFGVTFSSTTGSSSLIFKVLGNGVNISSGSSPAMITAGYTAHLTGACATNPCSCVGTWLNKQAVTVSQSGEVY